MGCQARKYFPHHLSEAEALRGEEIRNAALKEITSCKSVYRIFKRFCKINGIRCGIASLPFYIAQTEKVLGIRTVRLYTKRIRKYIRFLQDSESALFSGLLKYCDSTACTAPRRHARDLTVDQTLRLLQMLNEKNERAFLVAVLMASTGLRYIDLKYLPRSCIRSTSTPSGFRFQIDIKKSKVVRSDWLRQELVVPARLGLPELFTDSVRDAVNVLDSMDAREKIAPEGSSVDEFNQYLKEQWKILCKKGEVQGRYPTSYSFRRMAMNRFIESNRDGEGVVDWDRAATFSLHFRAGTLRAFYYKGLSTPEE